MESEFPDWEVRPDLLLAVRGLDTEELCDRLARYASTRSVYYAPAVTLASDGTALTVGGTFGFYAETPGMAVEESLKYLRQACAELDIPLGEIHEIVVTRGDVDPREVEW